MHVSEGYLSAMVLISGGVAAAAGSAIGLKRLHPDQIPQAGLLAAVFFVASLIHVPIGPANIHLVMNGLLGLLLGWISFPVIMAALLLQAVFFQYGGITTLGVNTVTMAAPAVAVHYLFGPLISRPGWVGVAAAFGGGAGAIALAAVVMAASLIFTDEQFLTVAATAVAIHLPIMIIEGMMSVFCVGFLKKVRPEMLPHVARRHQTPVGGNVMHGK